MSIKSKLVLVMILIILLPTFFLGFMNYQVANDVLSHELKLTAGQVVDKSIEALDFFLSSLESGTEMLSVTPSVMDILNNPEGLDDMMGVLKAYIEANPHVLHAYVGTKNGDMHIYPHTELPADFNPTQRPWYQDAVAADGLVWTSPYVDAGSGDLIVSVAKPVHRFGQLVGVMAMDVQINLLSELVSGITIGEEGYAALVGADGTTYVHKDIAFGEKIIDEVYESITTKESDVIDYTYEGDERFSVFNTIERTGWRLMGIVGYSEIKRNTSNILNQTILYGSIALVVAIIVGYIFASFTTKPLKGLVKDMELIGNGDFTIRSQVRSKDEVGTVSRSLNAMIEKLSILMSNLQDMTRQLNQAADGLAATSEETSASSEEVSRTVDEIATGASDQASEAEKGAVMTSSLSTKFVELSGNSQDMLKLSSEVISANEKGMEVVNGLNTKSESNKESILKIENAVGLLDNKAQSIGSILQTISDIAEQTNLLALNAAIEAARAGEAGRGFAVVADEIRKLAEQSGKSTDEIRSIILDIQTESNKTVNIMKEVKEQNQEQTLAVQDVSSSFQVIFKSIQQITSKINEISNYVEDMTKDGDQIVTVIENISAVSQETAAASEEVSASMEQTSNAVDEVARAANELNELADKLAEEINQFKI
ncbi:methyl-accepting chemotaxis protein [Alkaliphilus serpentinus]|uniref:Methyl-accepting chemotaxis protein n=1 Tax=Alkaliphilus serpentinus TaxID=1482731 RepID=A0A833M960_9FIRM|nr:methyl-accepting chemotaxis protein [Alkaliphilus serpentinus]KAB3532510.1 methyl-accepting chemotaxis protein [Alkaliphilus serpentinus]